MNWEDKEGAREPRETLLVRRETSDQYSDHSATSKNPSTSVRSMRLQVLYEEDERRKQEKAAMQTL